MREIIKIIKRDKMPEMRRKIIKGREMKGHPLATPNNRRILGPQLGFGAGVEVIASSSIDSIMVVYTSLHGDCSPHHPLISNKAKVSFSILLTSCHIGSTLF